MHLGMPPVKRRKEGGERKKGNDKDFYARPGLYAESTYQISHTAALTISHNDTGKTTKQRTWTPARRTHYSARESYWARW